MLSDSKNDRIRRDQLLGRLASLAGLVVGACLIFAGPNRSSEQPLATASVESTQQLVSLSSDKPKPTENRSVGTRPIESIRVGDRVLARNPAVSDAERAEWEEPDWNEWLHLSLQMPLPSDDQDAEPKILNIEILRPESWFWEQVSFAVEEADSGGEVVSPEMDDLAEPIIEPPLVPLSPLRSIYRDLAITSALLDAEEIDVVGMTVEMDLPEMGAFGTAVVTSLETCPPIREGKGQPVTATFSHPPSTQVLNVFFEGETDSIGVTDNHLFWSVDREQFIPIGQMEIGEQVQTYFGETKRIAGQLPRPGPQVVYNLEVYGEHVYFVGERGLLVHNNYVTPSELRRLKLTETKHRRANASIGKSVAERNTAPELGGRHRHTKKRGTAFETESHHPIADAISPIKTNDAPAIRMGAVGEHPLTGSYKSSRRAERFRHWQKKFINAGDLDGALELGIRDIRRVGKRLGDEHMFDDHIDQMMASLPRRPDGKVDWDQLDFK